MTLDRFVQARRKREAREVRRLMTTQTVRIWTSQIHKLLMDSSLAGMKYKGHESMEELVWDIEKRKRARVLHAMKIAESCSGNREGI